MTLQDPELGTRRFDGREIASARLPSERTGRTGSPVVHVIGVGPKGSTRSGHPGPETDTSPPHPDPTHIRAGVIATRNAQQTDLYFLPPSLGPLPKSQRGSQPNWLAAW